MKKIITAIVFIISGLIILYFFNYLSVSHTKLEKGEKFVLRVWEQTDALTSAGTKALVAKFEKDHPDIKIDMVFVGQMLNEQKFMCAVAGNIEPDVIFIARDYIAGWAARGAFLPLDELIEKDKEPYAVKKEDYYESAWKECSFENKVYGVATTMGAQALFYNKDILIQEGFVDSKGNAKPPKNWNELVEYGLKLTRKDEQGRITRLGFLPFSWSIKIYDLTLYGWQAGGDFLSEDGKICTMDSPEMVYSLEWLTKLVDAYGGMQKVLAFFESNASLGDLFLQDKVAMVNYNTWVVRRIGRFKPEFNFGITAMPPGPTGKTVTGGGGFAYSIPKKTKHVNEAWEYVKWMTSPKAEVLRAKVEKKYQKSEGGDHVLIMRGNMKANEAVIKEYPPDNENVKTALKDFLGILHYTKSKPVTVVSSKLAEEQGKAVEAAFLHSMVPKEALKLASFRVQQELDKSYQKESFPLVNWLYPVLVIIFALIIFIVFNCIRFMKAKQKGLAKPGVIKESMMGYLFVSPWIIGFVCFILAPVLISFVLSLCQYDVIHPARFVGFKNYIDLIKHDPVFFKSLYNTFFMVLGVPFNMAIGLLVALLLNSKVKGIAVYRTLFYLPAVVPVVAASVLWLWIFTPEVGLLDKMLVPILNFIGITATPKWLGSEVWSKPSIIIMGAWGAGAGMIIWLAGLKGIPEQLYEAAEIDGAGKFSKFFHITLPMLTPYIFFNLVIGIITVSQIFTEAYIMTKGGPADSTLFYVFYLFNNAFVYFKMGYASAMAWLLFIIVFILTLINTRFSKKWVYYEAEQK